MPMRPPPQSSFLLSLQENHGLPQLTAEIPCEPRHTVLVYGSTRRNLTTWDHDTDKAGPRH